MKLRNICWYVLQMIIMFGCSLAWNQEYYTGAVYEHSRQDNIKGDAATVIKANLKYYKRATKEARKQGADIIVFPEYGIFPHNNHRKELKKYLESVPNPKERKVTPCDEPDLFADKSIMHTLSCMAKVNQIVIVANMGGIEKCVNKTGCPNDGELHLNTNVVFDRTGTLIARYYKEHLFFELGMDLPRENQVPIFKTKFGKFATFICFDIIFEKMAAIAQLEDVDAVMFSTKWVDAAPFYTSTQWWQAWAIGNNATILAANMQIPGDFATGSGIFSGKTDSVAQTFNPDGVGKLIVAKIPRRRGEAISSAKITVIQKNGMKEWKDDGRDVPENCSYRILGPAKNIFKDYRCLIDNLENYTLVKLKKNENCLKICNNNMCCELDYMANEMNESYYFGVYNGTYNSFNRFFWWEESCFLGRCDDVNGTACSNSPMISRGTLFYKISMRANFTTKYIYPSLVSNRMRLVPVKNWIFNKQPYYTTITMNSDPGIALIAATLKGRVYKRDLSHIYDET